MNYVLSRQLCRVFIIGLFIFLCCTGDAEIMCANPAAGSVEAAGANPAAGSVEAAGANPAAGSVEAAGVNPAAGSVGTAGANPTAGSVEAAGANPVVGSVEAAGGESRRKLSYRAETEAHTLFMTIYDENGVKRLLSPKHPAVLTSGLYFVFPDGVRDYEICGNDGIWKQSGAQIYLFPQRERGEGICVRFRARGSDGRMRYSRSFVLTGSG